MDCFLLLLVGAGQHVRAEADVNTTRLVGEETGRAVWSAGVQGHLRAVKLE